MASVAPGSGPRRVARPLDPPRRASPGASAAGARARVDPSSLVGGSPLSTPPIRGHARAPSASSASRNPATPPIASGSRSAYSTPVASSLGSERPTSALSSGNGPVKRARDPGSPMLDSPNGPQAVFQPRATISAGARAASATPTSPMRRARSGDEGPRARSPTRTGQATLSPDLGRRSPVHRASPDLFARSTAAPRSPERQALPRTRSMMASTARPIVAKLRPADSPSAGFGQLEQPGVAPDAFIRPRGMSITSSSAATFAQPPTLSPTMVSFPTLSTLTTSPTLRADGFGPPMPGLGYDGSSASSSVTTPPGGTGARGPSPAFGAPKLTRAETLPTLGPVPMHRRSQSSSSSVAFPTTRLSAGPAEATIDERSFEDRERELRQRLKDELAEREREQDARIHRKILDLEISNASLLAINASLERGKHTQARELRELRRRFRDRSLHIPLASPSAASAEFPPGMMSPGAEYPPSDGEGDEVEQDWDTIMAEDPPFARCAAQLEDLIRRAQQAFEAKPEPVVTKVLPAFAARVDEDESLDVSMLSVDSPTLAFGPGGRLRRSPAASSLVSPDVSASLSAVSLASTLDESVDDSPVAVRVAKSSV